jgi:hypothetical protein
MPSGEINPEIKTGFTVAPEVVYSPIQPVPIGGQGVEQLFTTNRSEPETAIPNGELNPEIKAGFTGAPEVVYSPIVPLPSFVTNRSEPETAIPAGKLNPEIKAGFTVAPEVVYLPIVPLPELVTNRSEPETAMSSPPFNPPTNSCLPVPEVVNLLIALSLPTNRSEPETARPTEKSEGEINKGFTGAPEVVYLPMKPMLSVLATNRSEPETAIPNGSPNPEIRAGFTVAPEVVYSPIVPLKPSAVPLLTTKISSARAALLDSNPRRTATSPPNPCLYNIGNSFIQIFRRVQSAEGSPNPAAHCRLGTILLQGCQA